MVNVDELLWVSVGKWKPATLNLYHDAVSLLKDVGNIWQVVLNNFDFPGHEGLRLFVTIPVPAPHDFAAHQHLVAAHRVVRVCSRFQRVIIWENINQFHNEISIGGGNGGIQFCSNRSG